MSIDWLTDTSDALSMRALWRRLRKYPAVPRRVRRMVVFALVWVISPIELIPEFLPVIGPLDDLVAVALVLRYDGSHPRCWPKPGPPTPHC